MSELVDLIDRLGAASLDAQARIRESHEAIQDLRAATDLAREAARNARRAAEAAVGDLVTEAVVHEMATVPALLERVAADRVGDIMKQIAAALDPVVAQIGLTCQAVRSSDGWQLRTRG